LIDFAELARPKEHVVPVLNRSFVLHKKRYTVDTEDGWTLVCVENNRAVCLGPYVWERVKDPAYGYTLARQLVFANGDVAKRKWGLPLSVPLHFNVQDTFSSVRVIIWEDGKAYYVEPNYSDLLIYDVKSAYDEECHLPCKGVTPELRTLFLFHLLERERIRAILEEVRQTAAAEVAAAQHRERTSQLPFRLSLMFERAGATVSNFTVNADSIVVDWQVPGSSYKYNTVLDARTLKVREAGYCMSNDDKRHNITSLVLTAKDYDEDGLIHLTRR